MKGDFSRDTFHKEKQYSRVLYQQGRVQLDSDFNEQTAITLHYQRTAMVHLVGRYGGPNEGAGFLIELQDYKQNALEETGNEPGCIEKSIAINKGCYYVDGILCENINNTKFNDQPYNKEQKEHGFNIKEIKSGDYLFYLKVWERYITYREDDSIREKALSGPDTAGRAEIVWQVEQIKIEPAEENIISNDSKPECKEQHYKNIGLKFFKDKFENHQDSVRLSARLSSGDKDSLNKYDGPENNLYRVEIHTGGKCGVATFKWSRNNGAFFTIMKPNKNYDQINNDQIINLEVEDASGFSEGNWVELSTDINELQGVPGALVKLHKVKSNTLSILKPCNELEKIIADFEKKSIKVRLWDQKYGDDKKNIIISDGAILIKDDKFIGIEDGLEVKFKAHHGEFKTGDYWIIAARTATGNIEWNQGKNIENKWEDGEFREPAGIKYSYAPLSVLHIAAGRPEFYDIRSKFLTFRGIDEIKKKISDVTILLKNQKIALWILGIISFINFSILIYVWVLSNKSG